MKPYYDEGGITIYHGDCREYFFGNARVSDAETIITDPPYGTGYYDSDRAVLDKRLMECFLRQRASAVFGWPEALAGLSLLIERQPDEWIVWWPKNARMRGFNRVGLWRESEHIAIFGKGEWGRLRQPRRPTTTPMPEKNKRVKGDTGPVRMGDVWTDESPNINPRQIHKRHHPNEKPLTIMERLIQALTDENDLVLDPFMGSGTTLVASRELNRGAIGIEIEERYCEIAAERLSQEVLDLGAAA